MAFCEDPGSTGEPCVFCQGRNEQPGNMLLAQELIEELDREFCGTHGPQLEQLQLLTTRLEDYFRQLTLSINNIWSAIDKLGQYDMQKTEQVTALAQAVGHIVGGVHAADAAIKSTPVDDFPLAPGAGLVSIGAALFEGDDDHDDDDEYYYEDDDDYEDDSESDGRYQPSDN